MGCSILDMLFHLDLSLLEIMFVYTVKMSRKWIFSLFALISSIQLVTGLPDSTKGATKGYVVVSGLWAGSYEYPGQEFEPRHSLAIPSRVDHSSPILLVLIMRLLLMYTPRCIIGNKKRDRLLEWVEKASFDWLNKLFVISSSERHHQTLLID